MQHSNGKTNLDARTRLTSTLYLILSLETLAVAAFLLVVIGTLGGAR